MMGDTLSLLKGQRSKLISEKCKIKPLGRYIRILSFVLLTPIISGCLSNYGVAAFRSVPDGVRVFDMDDGSVIGVTPVNFKWKSGTVKRKYMNVRMHKDGYQDAVKSFWLNLGSRTAKSADKNPQLVQFELIKVSE